MNDFEVKRLKYFIKAAKTSDYIQLGQGDIKWLTELLDIVDEQQTLEVVRKAIDEKI